MKGETKLMVELIAIGVAAMVMLAVLFPPVRELLMGAGTQGQCRFSMLLSSGVAAVTFGLSDVPPECESEKVLVTKRELDRIISFHKPNDWFDKYKLAQPGTPEYRLRSFYDPDVGSSKYRWAYSKLVADKMNTCRENVWADVKLREGTLVSGPSSKLWCFVCSRITLDDEARNLVQGSLDFKDWMQAHKPRASKKSYYDLLKDVITPSSGIGAIMHTVALNIGFPKTQDRAVAVVYVHHPLAHQDDLRFITLFPYGQLLQKPISRFGIGRLGGFLAEEKKCEVIID